MGRLLWTFVILTMTVCGLTGCGDEPRLFLRPLIPPVVPTLTTSGPGQVEPGATAQFRAFSLVDGQWIDRTSAASWSSRHPGILTVGPDGVGAAHASGAATLVASYGNDTSERKVEVFPAGTYRLHVSAGGNIVASVEVVEGIGIGLKGTSIVEDDGLVSPAVVYGVAGPIAILVSAAGYESQIIRLTVQEHTQRSVSMTRLTSTP